MIKKSYPSKFGLFIDGKTNRSKRNFMYFFIIVALKLFFWCFVDSPSTDYFSFLIKDMIFLLLLFKNRYFSFLWKIINFPFWFNSHEDWNSSFLYVYFSTFLSFLSVCALTPLLSNLSSPGPLVCIVRWQKNHQVSEVGFIFRRPAHLPDVVLSRSLAQC